MQTGFLEISNKRLDFNRQYAKKKEHQNCLIFFQNNGKVALIMKTSLEPNQMFSDFLWNSCWAMDSFLEKNQFEWN